MNMKLFGRFIGKGAKLLLSLLIMVMAIPTMAFIEPAEIEAAIGNKKDLMFAETGLKYIRNAVPFDGNINDDWQGDILHLESYGGIWKILNKESSEFGNTGMLVLSHELGKIIDPPNSSGYDGSTIDTSIPKFLETELFDFEMEAFFNSTNTDNSTYTGEGSTIYRSELFSNKKWFAPTGKMLLSNKYGFSNKVTDNDVARLLDRPFLGNPLPFFTTDVEDENQDFLAGISGNGGFYRAKIDEDIRLRAAAVIDLDKVLFVSEPEKGKIQPIEGKFRPIEDTSTTTWKFTLKDSQQILNNVDALRTEMNKVEVTFDKVGKGTSLSAILTDSSGTNIMHYGRIATIAEGDVSGGKATITLPSDYDESGYKLKIFTEKLSKKDYTTDAASNIVDLPISKFAVSGTYDYRNADGTKAPELKTPYRIGQKFADLTPKPILVDHINGYRLINPLNPWKITPNTIDLDNIQDDFTATAQYLNTYKVKLMTGVDGATTYFDGTVDAGRNIGIDGIDGSSTDGKSRVEVESPIPPLGYRFDKWVYETIDGTPINDLKADVKDVNMDFVAKAKFVQQFTVNFRGLGGTVLDTQVVDIGTNAIDPLTRTVDPIEKKVLERKNYHYSQWENFYNVHEDREIMPLYIPFDYKIETQYNLFAYDETNSRNEFGALENADIDAKLIDTFDAVLLRDGFEQEKLNYNLSLSGVDYASLKNGIKGKYAIKFDYTNPEDSNFKATKSVVLKISDTEKNEAGAKIAANNFTISKNEAKASWFLNLVKLSSAQAYGSNGVEGKVKVTDFTKVKDVPGIYPISFSSQVQVESVIKELTATVNVTVKDDSNVDDDVVEQINGNNFTIKQSDVAALLLDDAQLIALGQVRANNVELGSDLAVSIEDKSGLIAEVGKHAVRFKTEKGTLLTLLVEVVDKEEVNPNPDIKEKISGNNFVLNTEQVKNLSIDKIKQLLIDAGNVKAINTETYKPVEILTVTHDVMAKSGDYNVTYKTANNTSLTLVATVKDYSNIDIVNREQISASDFMLETGKVKGITSNTLISKAKASALNIDTGAKVDISFVDKSQLLSRAGNYEVSFKTTKGTAITVMASVRDNVVEDDTTNEIITANDFFVKANEVKNLTKEKLIVLANAEARDVETDLSVPVSVKKSTIKGVAGIYSVQFTTTKGTEITVEVNVIDDFVEDDTTKERIYASNFTVKVSEVETLSDALIKTKANVQAFDIITGEDVANSDITVIGDVKAKAGVYPVTFKTVKNTSIDINVSVVDETGITPSPDVNESMSGNHFSLSLDEVKNIGNDKLITLGNVRAINTDTGAKVAVKVKTNNIKGVIGTHSVVYETEAGTTMTLNVSVFNKIVEDDNTNEIMVANDFSIKTEDVAGLNDSIIKTNANVKAYSLLDGKEIAILSVEHKIMAKAGAYPVTFKTALTSITTKVNVVDEIGVTPTPDVKESMSGNHFIIKSEDVSRIDDNKLISLGKVKAINTDTGKVVDVVTVTHSITSAVGDYDVIYKTAAGTLLTLKATVVDELEEDSITNEAMIANDFMVQTGQVVTLTDATIIAKAHVKAYSLIDGKENKAITVENKILGKAGVYPVTFTTDKKTKISIMATVVDEEDINTETNIRMSGNGFTVKSGEVKSLKANSEKLVDLGNVKAKNMLTGVESKVIVTINGLIEKPGVYNVVFGVDKDSATIKKSSLTLPVTVVDNYVDNIENNETIVASNATVLIDDVKTLDTKEILKRTGAKAFETDSKKAVAITKVTHTIKPVVGNYEVQLETAKETKMKVIVYVKNQYIEDPITGETISGSDFIISLDDAKKVTNSEILTLANVNAFVSATGESVDVRVIRGEFKASQGIYDITFKTAANTTLIVKGEVRGYVIEDQEKREKIWADDIYLGVNDVHKLDTEMLKKLANAKAINLDTSEEVDVVSADNNVLAEVGEYWVRFDTAKGSSVKIRAFVENSVEENIKNSERMTGSSFKLDITDVDSITNELLISKGNVKAIDTSTGMYVKVSVDMSALEPIEGAYPVVYTTDKGTSLTIFAQVIDRSQIREEVIGNDIYLNLEEARNINDDLLLAKSKARARDINSNAIIPIVKVENTVKASKGIYDASFETAKGALLLVSVHVNNEANLEASLGQQITGNRFVITLQEVSTLSDKTILSRGNIKAIDFDTNEFVNVIIDKSQIQAKEGLYNVKLSTSKGVGTTVQAEVKSELPETVVPEQPKEVVKNEVRKASQDDLIKEKDLEDLKVEKKTKESKKVVNSKNVLDKPVAKRDVQDKSFLEVIGENKLFYASCALLIGLGGYGVLRLLKKKKGL